MSRNERAAKRTVSEDVYRALKRDVITLRHRPGAPLTEQELADRYGVSRVPVREAVRRLSQEGLVDAIPYRGNFASRISLMEIADSFDLRLVLETHAVAEAVSRATDADLARLAELASAEYAPGDRESWDTFLDRNLEYHVALARLSGNRLLVKTLGELIESMQRYFYLGLELGDFGTEMRQEHEELTRLVRERRSEDAVRCARAQIERSRTRILDAIGGDRAELPVE